MSKKYKLSRKKLKKRIKKIVLRSSIQIGISVGVVTAFNAVDNAIEKRQDAYIIENETDIDYSYLDLSSYEGATIEEKYKNYKKEQDKYINRAIEYFSSEQYQIDLINGTAYYTPKEDRDLEVYDEVELVSYEEAVIRNYCNIYHVDFNQVFTKLFELTEGFRSEEYLNGTIPGINFKKEQAYFDNPETLLLVAVRCCAQTPQDVGLPNVKVDKDYKSPYTKEQEMYYYANLFGIDPSLAIGVSIAEGNATNNIGSLKSIDGSFESYSNQTEGVIEMVAELYKFVKDGYRTPEAMQPIYAPLDDGELNANWIVNVKDGMAKARAYVDELDVVDYNFEGYERLVNNMYTTSL